MKNKCIFLIFFLILFSLNFILANQNLNSLSSLRQTKILNEFNQTDFVSIIVEVYSPEKIDNLISSFSKIDFKNVKKEISPNIFTVKVTKKGLEKLSNDSLVKEINLEKPLSLVLSESVPLINATQVWTNGYTGKGQTVCIIDSGVNASHPDLQGKIIAEECLCRSPEGNNTYCCPGGVIESNNSEDYLGHGTHVAGIIVSQDVNYKGVAPNASVVIIKVCNSSVTNGCNPTDIINGINWCTDHKTIYNISIITLSISDGGVYAPGNCYPSWADSSITNAVSEGIFVDIASGNQGGTSGIGYPSCSPDAVSVGASTKNDGIASYTNRASNLDLLAPGSGIWSLRWNSNSNMASCFSVGDIMMCSGTSMAAPHVAGVAALLKERDPALTPNNITTILKNNNVSIYDSETGLKFPRIDALKAINSLCVCSDWTQWDCGTGTCLSSERQYTRICADDCSIETKCEYDSSCIPSGGEGTSEELTVCASGCNATTIQGAVRISDANDKIFILDNRTYAEEIVMNSTSSGWLDCGTNGSKIIDFSGGRGIFLNHVDGPVVVNCYIEGYDYGIYLNSSDGVIQNNTLINNDEGIRLWKDWSSGNKIKYNNITGNNIYGIYFYTTTWAAGGISNKIQNNFLADNGEDLYSRYGIYHDIRNNNIHEGTYGVHLYGSDLTSFASIYDNLIFNNGEGVYLHGSNNNLLGNNTFCSSNINVDIHNTGITNSGENNTCELPGIWNDSGTTGCTYYCDSPASATLLFPPNNYEDDDGNIDLICESQDNSQLVNVSLYHNISGGWQLNQTKNISGTSNITTFTFNNLENATNFIWNCLTYDNHSRGSFAPANWSLSISLVPQDSYKFYIKNYSNDNVVWFGNLGNIALKGICFNQTTCTAPVNSFIIANNTDDTTSYIDNSGNLCIEKGDCSELSGNCNPIRTAFIIKNSSDHNMSYIDFDGDLCLTGKLYQNSAYV